MTNARMMVAIEEVLTASTGSVSFGWHESRDDGGLELICTPSAPDWVAPGDREDWQLAHGLDVWIPSNRRTADQLRGDALGLMLADAIRRAAGTRHVRAGALAGLAA
jgi:hypothetical protein